MKRGFLLTILSCLLMFTAMADILLPGQPRVAKREHQPHPRGEFSFEKYQEDKCNFIIKELGLTAEETDKFLPVYRELLQAKSSLYHKYGGAHRIMRSVNEGQEVADTTMQRAVQNSRKLQLEDAKLEQDYLVKFEKILTPKQIIKLQEAEQKFKNEMMKRVPMPRPRH